MVRTSHGGKILLWQHTKRIGKKKKKLLAQAEIEAMQSGDNSQIRELKNEINVLLDREARMWSQRSRVKWVNEGDNNTKYFHSRATQRLRKNKILEIKDNEGFWHDQQSDISEVLVNYFQDLFSSSRPNLNDCVLDQIQPVITNAMNSQLTSNFTASEVDVALKQMAPLKALGPNGMPPLFYQHFWSILDNDVT